jgi:ATP-binding cassette subfamily B protein
VTGLMPLLSLAVPYGRSLVLGSLLMLAESVVALGLPWLAGLYAGRLLGLSATSKAILGLLLLLLLVQSLLRFISANILGGTAERIAADLRLRLYDHLQGLPLQYFQQHRRGEIEALLTWETDQLAGFLGSTLVSVLPQLLAVIGSVALMLTIDPMLALVVAALVPLSALVLKIAGRQLRPLALQVQQAYADNTTFIDENLEMIPAIKAFNREQVESTLFRNKTDKLLELLLKQLRIQSLLNPLLQFIAAAGVLTLLLVASSRLVEASLQPVQLVIFLLYAVMLTRPVAELAGVWGQLQSARGAVQHLLQVLEEQPESGNPQGLVLQHVRGELQFDNVVFAYPGRATLFDGLSLHVAAGETLAIVGENGSGKSTLIQLLLLLQVPHAGRIRLDGHDISTLNLHFLRQQVALVSQQVLLLNATVAANIGYAKATATGDEIVQAARLAQAHDFISALPQGYDTVIGDQGVRLSGGQRQRLALARALLKQAPIVVLDEASAMFDPAAEVAMLADCQQVLRHSTVILITHRPASLALADRILCMHEGRLEPRVVPGPAVGVVPSIPASS